MARLTEEMVVARSRQSDLSAVKKLNCWGAELVDVSLLRRMPNVEVLALSVNKITTLADFAYCPRLKELYIRKNLVRDLSEIRHLQSLSRLTELWLEENPCTDRANYRMTVLRNLPNLQKLDNVVVQPEELEEAMRKGTPIADPDDEYYQQEEYSQFGRSRECSPDRLTERAEPLEYRRDQISPIRHRSFSPETEERCGYTSSGARAPQYYEQDYTTNGDSYRQHPSPHYRHSADVQNYDTHPERSESYQQVPQRCALECDRESSRESLSRRERDGDIASAVMAEHRGFTRRPMTRNSNLLSAVLCLVKELDYPSLEVAEMAVRCRMDELANQP